MPTAILATAKDPAANSYATLAFAGTYFGDRANSTAWGVDVPTQTIAMLSACKRMEQEKYKGARTTTTQALKFPRTGLTDDDGQPVNPDTNPLQVQYAQCELALAIMTAGASDITAGTGLEAFKSLGVGSIKLDLRDPVVSGSDNSNMYPKVPGDPANSVAVSRWQLPFQVQRLLRNWLITDVPQTTSGWGAVRLSKS